MITDPDFGNPIVRVTDANTDPSRPNLTMVAGEGGSADVEEWNTNSTLFWTGSTTPTHYLWTFNPNTMQVGRMYASSFLSMGGMTFSATGGAQWSRLNSQVLYIFSGTRIERLGFASRTNPPSPQLVYDYTNSANCLGSGFRSIWNADPTVSAGDSAFSEDFSNLGGQGGPGANYIAVYTVGKGCRVWNTATGQVTGDWGPTGAVSIPDRFHVHNARISKDGNWMVVIPQGCVSTCTSLAPYFWQINGLTVNQCGDVDSCEGHWTEGYTHWVNSAGNQTGQQIIRPFDNASSTTNLIRNFPALTAPFDLHESWNNVDVNDSVPFFLTTVLNTIPFPSAWYREILGVASNGSGTVWRFAHTFSSGQSQRFATNQAIGAVSQDGKFFIFSSDWMGTLGSESGSSSCTLGTNCRGDVFIVKLQ